MSEQENPTAEPMPPFGPASRPDHPDFWRLSEIVLSMEERLNEALKADPGGDPFLEMLHRHIDSASLIYMIMQRSMRAHEVDNAADLLGKMPEVYRSASIGLEAFMMGVLYQQVVTSQADVDVSGETGEPTT